MLSAEYEDAWNVITNGVRPSYWTSRGGWSKDGRDTMATSMAGFAIACLGISGRAEAAAILADLRRAIEDGDAEFSGFQGDSVQAAFYASVVRGQGAEFLKQNFHGDPQETLRKEWDRSAEGKEWTSWYTRMNRLGR
jgi:hypothetical protein